MCRTTSFATYLNRNGFLQLEALVARAHYKTEDDT